MEQAARACEACRRACAILLVSAILGWGVRRPVQGLRTLCVWGRGLSGVVAGAAGQQGERHTLRAPVWGKLPRDGRPYEGRVQPPPTPGGHHRLSYSCCCGLAVQAGEPAGMGLDAGGEHVISRMRIWAALSYLRCAISFPFQSARELLQQFGNVRVVVVDRFIHGPNVLVGRPHSGGHQLMSLAAFVGDAGAMMPMLLAAMTPATVSQVARSSTVASKARVNADAGDDGEPGAADGEPADPTGGIGERAPKQHPKQRPAGRSREPCGWLCGRLLTGGGPISFPAPATYCVTAWRMWSARLLK